MGQSCCNTSNIETTRQLTDQCQCIERMPFCENLEDILNKDEQESQKSVQKNIAHVFTFQQYYVNSCNFTNEEGISNYLKSEFESPNFQKAIQNQK